MIVAVLFASKVSVIVPHHAGGSQTDKDKTVHKKIPVSKSNISQHDWVGNVFFSKSLCTNGCNSLR